MNLVQQLCSLLGCTSDNLYIELCDAVQRDKVIKFIKAFSLYNEESEQKPFEGLSILGANQTFAYICGYLNITLEQYHFIKHGKTLKYPHLPCIKTKQNGTLGQYYPMELLTVVDKSEDVTRLLQNNNA